MTVALTGYLCLFVLVKIAMALKYAETTSKVTVEVAGMSNIGKYTLFNVVATLRNCWRQVALVPLNSVIIYYSDTESPKARKLAREKRMERGKGTDDARLNAP